MVIRGVSVSGCSLLNRLETTENPLSASESRGW